MTHIVVYDAHGEMFEVPIFVARRLVVNHGWTFLPPKEFKQPFDDAHFVTAAEDQSEPQS